MKLPRFFVEHSLSLVLGTTGGAFMLLARFSEPGTWLYDFWFTVGGGLFGGAVIAVASRWLWEKDSDPTKPPSP